MSQTYRAYGYGTMATPAKLNELLTQRWAARAEWDKPVEVHPDAFRVVPTGHRLLVVLDPVPETFKGVVLPEAYRASEQTGIGTIMGVGDAAFSGAAPYPGGPLLPDPLYRTVIMGQHTGTPIRLDFVRDASYWGAVIIMTDRDVWALLDEGEAYTS